MNPIPPSWVYGLNVTRRESETFGLSAKQDCKYMASKGGIGRWAAGGAGVISTGFYLGSPPYQGSKYKARDTLPCQAAPWYR